MHKSIILITLMLAACGNSADISPKSIVREPAANVLLAQIPGGFSVVEQSPSGYFVRLTSPERASTSQLRALDESLSGTFDRIDLCLDVAHERGDEYAAIIDGKVYDYVNNRIFTLNGISK